MAKKPKTISVSGLSIKQIMRMDVNKLGEKDLRTVATRLMSASNKRINRLLKADYGQYSPAYSRYRKQGRLFSVKGKSISQLRAEFANMRDFMQMKTSTLSGWKKVRKNLNKAVGGKLSDAQVNKFWSVYSKLEEEMGGIIKAQGDSDKIQKMLRQEVLEDGDSDEILNKMMDYIDTLYEEQQAKENEEGNATDVFDFDGVL